MCIALQIILILIGACRNFIIVIIFYFNIKRNIPKKNELSTFIRCLQF